MIVSGDQYVFCFFILLQYHSINKERKKNNKVTKCEYTNISLIIIIWWLLSICLPVRIYICFITFFCIYFIDFHHILKVFSSFGQIRYTKLTHISHTSKVKGLANWTNVKKNKRNSCLLLLSMNFAFFALPEIHFTCIINIVQRDFTQLTAEINLSTSLIYIVCVWFLFFFFKSTILCSHFVN